MIGRDERPYDLAFAVKANNRNVWQRIDVDLERPISVDIRQDCAMAARLCEGT